MPAKPPITLADDNKTPTTAVQNSATENWYQPVGAEDGAIETMGAKDDAAVTDPTLSASEIALLKGLMKQLQGTGTGAAPVSITQSSVTIPTSATLANVEGTLGSAAPIKAVQISGVDGGGNARVPITELLGNGDGMTASWRAWLAGTYGLKFNGSTWDRERNNTEGTLLASAARTATTSSANQTNHNARGVILTLDVTANPGGAETLTVIVQVVDPTTGKAAAIANSGVMITAANGTRTFEIYPGAVETIANSELFVQGIAVPRTWKAIVLHSATGSWTYSLGYAYIV